MLANQIMAEGGPVKWLTPDNFQEVIFEDPNN